MLKKRIIIMLSFVDGVLFRTKKFKPDYRYTKNFVDMWEADEIILLDISRTHKLTSAFLEIAKFFCQNCFLPLSIGGGIRSIKDADKLFRIGADKIVLNSSTPKNKNLITEIQKIYGSQSIIHSVDFKKEKNNYEIFFDDGTKKNNISIEKWIKILEECGVGEILLNDMDNDGSLLGYNLEFLKKISNMTQLPLIALGGAGKWEHFLELFKKTKINAAASQNIFHFTNESLSSLKNYLLINKVNIRK